ncbi:DUF4426 domain-containing protein [Marinobacterium aestuariivivens]|uniref:DUF4426 domain-containing protein n=1 Tax=Marinobacterium aestuariivivens TaxID=1698799 RepID=A0ABW1ZYY0_9GAMM
MRAINLSPVGAAASLAALLLAATPAVNADQSVSYGDYEVHYNAFNSTFLEPDVAESYGLTRSGNLALINVSVLQKQADGSMKPVTADINGTANNLIGQSLKLDFQEIRETDALYYIGGLRFAGEQLMRINLEVQPESHPSPYSIQFEQTFYPE